MVSIIETALGKVEYEMYGSYEPYIMCCHGTSGNLGQIAPYINDIVEQYNCTVVAWSRPGYGATPLVLLSFREQAELLNCLMIALDIHKAVIYGISTGTCIAYNFCSSYPDKCIGLIVESAINKKYSSIHSSFAQKLVYNSGTFYRAIAKTLVKRFPARAINTFLRATSSLSKKERKRVLRHFDENRLRLFKKVANNLLSKDCGGYANDTFQLKSNDYPFMIIKCPTLIVHGKADLISPYTNAEYIKRSIENSELATIPGGHMLFLSNTDKLYAAKERFLNRICGRTGKGIDTVQYDSSLPFNYKRFPTKMPMHRVGYTDVVAVKADGQEFPIFCQDDPLREYTFMTILRKYGGLHGGVGINENTFCPMFRIRNKNGGFIPLIMFPALKERCGGTARITIDGNVTEIVVPPLNTGIWRPVIGGYFPFESKQIDNSVTMVLGEKKMLNIVSPIHEIEANSPGLYFESSMLIEFKGRVCEEHHGNWSCFTYIKFTER